MGLDANYRDGRYILRKGLAEILGFPVVFSVHPDWVERKSGSTTTVSSRRIAALIVTAAMTLVARLRRGATPSRIPPAARYTYGGRGVNLRGAGCLAFAIYRYIV